MDNRSDYALPFALVTIGGLLTYSGFKGKSMVQVLAGDIGGALNPAGGKADIPTSDHGGTTDPGSATLSGTPKAIIDTQVLPVAKAHGMTTGVDPGQVAAANAAHGPTTSGGRSDHQGPPDVAWAVDMSNGSSPTPEMDALAADLAKRFNIPWHGSGLANHTENGYRFQLIYRSNIGGNHYNHVHLGVRKV